MSCKSRQEFHAIATTWYGLENISHANSTGKSWNSKLKRILLFFGSKETHEIVRSDIFRYLDVNRNLENNALNENQPLLRKVFRFSIGNRLTPIPPIEGIENLRVGPTICDPFSRSEIEVLTCEPPECDSIKNATLLACYTRLRKSEWIRLIVDDYDLIKGLPSQTIFILICRLPSIFLETQQKDDRYVTKYAFATLYTSQKMTYSFSVGASSLNPTAEPVILGVLL